MKKKIALICGISGQDGSLLANFLIKKRYKVIGTSRDAEAGNFNNLEALGIKKNIKFLSMNYEDFHSSLKVLKASLPDEIYYLSGQSSVSLSFEQPSETLKSNVLGFLNLLEACRMINKKTRIYYAGSSECFGNTNKYAANEKTKFDPKSPYAVAKSSAFWLANNYRSSYNLHISTGICFNHESPFRNNRFVTKKIISTAVNIANGSKEKLILGDLNISRDWGWAEEYIKAMWLMLQQKKAEDFVIATGETNSLKNFVKEVFNQFNLDWKKYVVQDKKLFRPQDIIYSKADPKKALKKLNWKAKFKMNDIIKLMIKANNIK